IATPTHGASRSWLNRVVPFSVELMPFEFETLHLLRRDLDAPCVGVAIESRLDDESGAGFRCGNQTHYRAVVGEGPAAPVQGDEGEEPVLDLVPLARAGREVAHGDGKS